MNLITKFGGHAKGLSDASNVVPHFVHECDRCRIQACRECRYHQLQLEDDSDSDSGDSGW